MEKLDILWVAIPLLILTICMSFDSVPPCFTARYWQRLLSRLRHRNAELGNELKNKWDREEQRIVRKIMKKENKRKKEHNA